MSSAIFTEFIFILKYFKGLETANVGYDYPGVPSCVADNRKNMLFWLYVKAFIIVQISDDVFMIKL